MIDDSALFHGRYDPVKAREYYLRTRQLKGRKSASAPASPGRTAARSTSVPARSSGGKPNRAHTKSRRAELQAQKEALEKRLDHLRDVLRELVEAAKGRSGVKKNEKDKAPETSADKADRNKDQKNKKPETAAQKKERAKKAKEAYEKENPTSLSQDVDVLKEQVADIQAKIQKAITDARDRKQRAGNRDKNRPAKDNSDGPRGR